jgi:hypothetical protein
MGYWVNIVNSMVFGGGCGGLVTYFFKKSIASKFYKENTEFKNKMAQQHTEFKSTIEHELDSLLDRKIKWHDYERKILLKTWTKLINAYWSLYGLTEQDVKFNLQWDSMTDEDFLTSLNKTNLTDEMKKYLADKKKGGRMHAYLRTQYLDSQHQAIDLIFEFRRYFTHNKIFIKPHIKKAFESVLYHFGLITWKEQHDFYINKKLTSSSQTFEKNLNAIKPYIDEIEKIIQDELYPQTMEKK